MQLQPPNTESSGLVGAILEIARRRARLVAEIGLAIDRNDLDEVLRIAWELAGRERPASLPKVGQIT